MWDRFQSGIWGKPSGPPWSGDSSSDHDIGQAWLDQLRADGKVVVSTTRPLIENSVLDIARKAGVRLSDDPEFAQPGDLVIVDHLFPELQASHLGNLVVVGMIGEEQMLLQCARRLGVAHAIVLPTGRDWLSKYMVRAVGGTEHESAAKTHHLEYSPTEYGPQEVGRKERRTNCEGTATPRAGTAHLFSGNALAVDNELVPTDVLPTKVESTEVAEFPSHKGLCIGVIPGCGGCGASTVAVALGLAAARVRDVLVVDADPWGQGMGASLGSDWPQFGGWRAIAPNTKQIEAAELRAALPRDPGFWVLGGAASVAADIPPALPAVTAAARDGFDVTVVDLGRTTAGVAAARLCDVTVVVLTTNLAGVLGTRRILEQLVASREASGSASVVLVCRDVGGLTPQDIAEHLGHEVGLILGNSRLIAERAAAGELVRGRSGRRLANWGDRLLAVLT